MRTKFTFRMAALAALLISASAALAQNPSQTAPPRPLHEQLQKQQFPTAVPVPTEEDATRLYQEGIKAIAEGHVGLAGYAEQGATEQFMGYLGYPQTKKTKKQEFLDQWTKPPFELKTLADSDKAIQQALKSLGHRFDSYMVPQQVKAEDKELDNENVGIGVTVKMKDMEELLKDLPKDATGEMVNKALIVSDKHPIIMSPIKGGPADKAGMKADDIIVEVAGKAVNGRTYEEVLKEIRGKKGTTIDITVKRTENGKEEQKKLTITRDTYQMPVVHLKDLGDGIFQVKLDTFAARGAAKQVEEALKEALSKGAKSIVFDLRDNGGGLLNEAIDIISFFLPEGNIVAQQSRLNGGTDLFETRHHVTLDVMLQTFPQSNGILPITSQRKLVVPADMPVVVLINQWSASASELTSGALKFNGRARIVGVRTLGKGVGQSLLDLPYGRRLHLTTFNFLPANKKIDWLGVGPHDEIKEDEAATKAGKDNQLDGAKRIALELYNKGVKDREDQVKEDARVLEMKKVEWAKIQERREAARAAAEKKRQEEEDAKKKKEQEKKDAESGKTPPATNPAPTVTPPAATPPAATPPAATPPAATPPAAAPTTPPAAAPTTPPAGTPPATKPMTPPAAPPGTSPSTPPATPPSTPATPATPSTSPVPPMTPPVIPPAKDSKEIPPAPSAPEDPEEPIDG